MRLGPTPENSWNVGRDEVDLVRPSAPPRRLKIKAQPQTVVIDLVRTAVIVVDMQNDFCTPGGWMDAIGVDIEASRKAIEPLNNLLPVLRKAGVPVLWVNWGNRPDRANLPPWAFHTGRPTGEGFGYGDTTPDGKGPILERGSWGAAVVDELAVEPTDVPVHKYRFSGFHDNELDSVLRNRAITTLFFTGTNTEVCVLATFMGASFHGYDCIMVEDACSTPAPAASTEMVMRLVRDLYGFTTTSADIVNAVREQGHE